MHPQPPPGRATSARALLPTLLFLVALALFGLYIHRNADRFGPLLQISATSLLTLVTLVLVFLVGNGIINLLFYRGLEVPLSINEGVGLAAVNTLANQLPFAGGLVAKGVYLKQKHRLSYTRYFSATLALYVCFVAANGVVGLLVVAYQAWGVGMVVPALLPLGFAIMSSSLLVIALPLGRLPLPAKWRRRVEQLLHGWLMLRQNPSLLLRLLGVQMSLTMLFAARLWLSFHVMSQPVTLADCLLFSAATILSRLVSIAPGGLGVREGIVAGMAALLGLDAGIAVVAVGIDRLISTIIIMIIGTIYSYTMSRGLSNHS